VQTENEKAVRDPMRGAFLSWWHASKYMQVVFSSDSTRQVAWDSWQAALQSQVSNTDVLEKIVKVADEQPFCSIGHIVEHVVPEIRDALAAPKAPQQVSNTPQDGWKVTRSIIKECPALIVPQTLLQKLGSTAQIIPLPGFTEQAANEMANALNSTPPQQQEQSGEATLVYALRAARPFVVLCDNCGDEGRKETLKLIDAAIGNDSSPATPTATASQASREEQMVTLRFDESGKPTVWCDPEIADLVDALNTDNLSTVASCSGHGHRPGRISLKDGRQLLVMNSEQVATVERLFGIDINGASQESAPGQEAVAEVVGVSMLGDNAPLAKHIQTLPGKSVEIGNKLYLAPHTSTAIAAMVIKQAADIVVDRAHTPYAKNWDEVAETIRNLLPANAEEELVKVILKVINEAQEYTEEGVRRALDGEVE
jgi:hypothetical protein